MTLPWAGTATSIGVMKISVKATSVMFLQKMLAHNVESVKVQKTSVLHSATVTHLTMVMAHVILIEKDIGHATIIGALLMRSMASRLFRHAQNVEAVSGPTPGLSRLSYLGSKLTMRVMIGMIM